MFYNFKKMLVKHVMSKDFLLIDKNEKLNSSIEKMLANNFEEMFIINENKDLIGLITLKDVSNIKKNNLNENLSVKEYMNSKIITIDKEEDISKCRDIMLINKIGRLPVVENNKLIGVIRTKEIRDYYYMKVEELNVQLDNIISNINEAVCVINKEGIVVLWNKKAEELYDVMSHEIIGKKITDFFPNAMMWKVLKDKKPIYNALHKPKENSFVILSIFPVYIKGEFLGVVSTDRDVTEVIGLSQKLEKVTNTLNYLKKEVDKYSSNSFSHIIGKSDKILEKIEIAKQVSKSDISILITGESGTGKEVFARAIHEYSGKKGLFVPVNCSAIPSELLESELFGYEGGAFSGANKKGKIGLFELANNGTIFLDEIGEMPLFMQAKLLRVLQEKEIRRVGGTKSIKIDTRVISATNKDLKKLIKEGKFREDLYYRLNVVEIKLPPLRERKEDIVLLIDYFIEGICERNSLKLPKIDKEVYSILENYEWKGNIRELKNIVEYLIIFSKDGHISKDIIPNHIVLKNEYYRQKEEYLLDLNEAIKRLEIELIKKALKISNSNKAEAAKLLNIPRSTLYYKIDNYNIK